MNDVNKSDLIKKGYLNYEIEGVIGDYLDEWSDHDLPYRTIRALSEHLVEWLFAMRRRIIKVLGEEDGTKS